MISNYAKTVEKIRDWLCLLILIEYNGVCCRRNSASIEIYENNGRTTKLVDTIYATDRGYEHMLGSGTYHASNITYDGTIGYQYYVKVHFTASNSNGGDTATSTSRAVTAIK